MSRGKTGPHRTHLHHHPNREYPKIKDPPNETNVFAEDVPQNDKAHTFEVPCDLRPLVSYLGVHREQQPVLLLAPGADVQPLLEVVRVALSALFVRAPSHHLGDLGQIRSSQIIRRQSMAATHENENDIATEKPEALFGHQRLLPLFENLRPEFDLDLQKLLVSTIDTHVGDPVR